jgi:5'-nucleotidase
MNILLTNDDGIASPGIRKLAEFLRAQGKYRVYIIAPDSNRSGVSHGLAILNGPVKLAPQGEDAWSCSGYPADCVIVAVLGGLPAKPDLVISGINEGANLGSDIIYSGTAAAARQASLMQIPALALSLAGKSPFCWDMAASWAADHLEELRGFWKEDTFVNVNIPNSPGGPSGIALAWPGVKHYHDSLEVMNAPDSSRWCFLAGGKGSETDEGGSDCDAVFRNLVSLSSVFNHPVVRRDLCPGVPEYASAGSRSGKKE